MYGYSIRPRRFPTPTCDVWAQIRRRRPVGRRAPFPLFRPGARELRLTTDGGGGFLVGHASGENLTDDARLRLSALWEAAVRRDSSEGLNAPEADGPPRRSKSGRQVRLFATQAHKSLSAPGSGRSNRRASSNRRRLARGAAPCPAAYREPASMDREDATSFPA
jgi:hypothetical protein